MNKPVDPIHSRPLLKPKTITVLDGDGTPHQIIISKFPATDGLEINVLYPTSLALAAIPKLGDYKISDDLMRKIMSFCAVDIEGRIIRLETKDFINSHLPDWESLVRTIWEIMRYNNSFFRNGTISDFFASFVQTFVAKITEMLNRSSEQLLAQVKPPSTS